MAEEKKKRGGARIIRDLVIALAALITAATNLIIHLIK